MFITNAYAQAAGGSGEQMSTLMTFAPFILIFVIMYFLIIRPNRNQAKQRQEMLNAVRRGDTVITEGGLIGRVTKVIGDITGEVEVEIAENTRVRVLRSKILTVEAKGEPVKEAKSKPVEKSRKGKKSSVKAQKTTDNPAEKATTDVQNANEASSGEAQGAENKAENAVKEEKTGA